VFLCGLCGKNISRYVRQERKKINHSEHSETQRWNPVAALLYYMIGKDYPLCFFVAFVGKISPAKFAENAKNKPQRPQRNTALEFSHRVAALNDCRG
jgi:hypothetical protein